MIFSVILGEFCLLTLESVDTLVSCFHNYVFSIFIEKTKQAGFIK